MEVKIIKTYTQGITTLKEGRLCIVTNEFGKQLIKDGFAEHTTGIAKSEEELVAEHMRKRDPAIHIHINEEE